ncbi:MAG: hypothetical protein IKN54_09985, partial [Lachnospiraceae bacterium]|nr:hypothetical protein [Lachnospiraceae bacterium]
LPQTVPDADTDVIIPVSGNYPIVSSSAAVKSIETSSTVSVNENVRFEIKQGSEISNKITGDGTLVLSSGNSFTIPVGQTFNINIENNGTLEPSSSSGTVSFGKNFVNNGTLSNFGASVSVSIAGNFNNERTSTISGAVQITGDLTNNSSITFNGAVTVGGKVTNNNTAIFASATTISGDLDNGNSASITGAISVGGNLTNGSSATFNGDVEVAGNVTDSGGITNTITLTGAGPHTFEGSGTNYSVVLTGSGNTTFKDALTITSLTESSYSGAITFSGDDDQTIPAGTYSSIEVNKDSGNFIIGTGDTTIGTFTQTKGASVFNGTLTVTNYIQKDDVVFNGDLNVKSYSYNSGAITLKGNTTFTDGSSNTAANFGSAVLSISGGTEGTPKTITATSFAAGSIICTDGATVGAAASYLDIEATGGITITGDIGGDTHYYKKVVLNAGSNDISIRGNIYTSDITVGCRDVEFRHKIFVGGVTINATGAVSINSLEAQSLTINSGSPIKMAGKIELTGSNDFVIDYPLWLTADAEFDITGKIIIQDSGIIKSDASSGKNLTLTASSIQLENTNPLGASGTAELGTITINSPITLNSDSAIYSTETVFEGDAARAITGSH